MANEELILQKLNDMEKNIHNMSVRVQSISRALKGDPEYEQAGLIHEIKEAKKNNTSLREAFDNHTEKQKLKEAKQKGLVLGIGIAGGGFGAWLKSFFGL